MYACTKNWCLCFSFNLSPTPKQKEGTEADRRAPMTGGGEGDSLVVNMGKSWQDALSPEFSKPYFKEVCVCVCVCVWERERERERDCMVMCVGWTTCAGYVIFLIYISKLYSLYSIRMRGLHDPLNPCLAHSHVQWAKTIVDLLLWLCLS